MSNTQKLVKWTNCNLRIPRLRRLQKQFIAIEFAFHYSAVQSNSDSDEMRQIFVEIRFNLKSHKNYLTNDPFNTKYDHSFPL